MLFIIVDQNCVYGTMTDTKITIPIGLNGIAHYGKRASINIGS